MNENRKVPPHFDGGLFSTNRNKLPQEERLKYAGKCVAYSLDGTRIVGWGEDFDDLERRLIAAGIDPSTIVESYIPSPEEHTLL
jgi:hypothetical protein